ncbi:MAG: hydroxymethylglutaryl-CoA lyase [Chitinophagales bacterium]|nr:MAG: hydroxymethylglutaryl-CoA lyase [Chitinophagales bacterium]
MQGIKVFIPTEAKVEYINALLKVGFDTIDVGSFVSARYVPQMADTADVLRQIHWSESSSKLSVIVANVRGAIEACQYPQVTYLGYPFSISETFQLRNTNSTMEKALKTVASIREIASRKGKGFVVYLSMAFGNPYGDPWSLEIAEKWVAEIDQFQVQYISLSDTIGVARPDVIEDFFKHFTHRFPHIEFGAHFHTTPDSWREKVDAAYHNGCKRFDGAIKGYGGCPMAKDELVGNMPTENLVTYFEEVQESTGINKERLKEAILAASRVFPA